VLKFDPMSDDKIHLRNRAESAYRLGREKPLGLSAIPELVPWNYLSLSSSQIGPFDEGTDSNITSSSTPTTTSGVFDDGNFHNQEKECVQGR